MSRTADGAQGEQLNFRLVSLHERNQVRDDLLAPSGQSLARAAGAPSRIGVLAGLLHFFDETLDGRGVEGLGTRRRWRRQCGTGSRHHHEPESGDQDEGDAATEAPLSAGKATSLCHSSIPQVPHRSGRWRRFMAMI
jgi:hypothetical protein